MERNEVSGIMLPLMLISVLALAFGIQSVKATGTIYIKSDGSVDGTDKILQDGDTYTFTDNIYDSIVVEKSNIVIDGNGYTLQGTGAYESVGILLSSRENVTIQNTQIVYFASGIGLYKSFNSNISGNTLTNNEGEGIWLGYGLDASSNNIVSGNTITNSRCGIEVDFGSRYNSINRNIITLGLWGIAMGRGGSCNNVSENIITANSQDGILIDTSGNNINGNTITNNNIGISVSQEPSNNIIGNTIANNVYGIAIGWSGGNKIYHNNFDHNTQQVREVFRSADAWDNGYPSGGNYWSDYTGVDVKSGSDQNQGGGGDGIGDTPYVIPYVIDAQYVDHYPLMTPWVGIVTATVDIEPDCLNLRSGMPRITAYIELAVPYNPRDIDVSTVKLNGAVPAEPQPIQIGDYDSDKILDLMVKFDKANVTPLLHAGINRLTVTGTVRGIMFEAVDTIRVIA